MDSLTILYEYCNNGCLATYQKVQPLKVFFQICLGVKYLHSKSIIVKNLSVFSILLNENIPKIAGLEIAAEEEALLDQDDSICRDYISYIDPEWRAPELNENGSCTKQSDI